MGVALAYYIALSLALAALIVLAIAGFAFGAQAAEGRLVSQIRGFVGYEGANAIQAMIEGAGRSSSKGLAATVLGLSPCFSQVLRWSAN
jgi:membrane protein